MAPRLLLVNQGDKFSLFGGLEHLVGDRDLRVRPHVDVVGLRIAIGIQYGLARASN